MTSSNPTRPRVTYWNSQPTPYMVDRWNAIARRGNIDLSAWFNVEREPDRSWSVDEGAWEFHGGYLDSQSLVGARLYLPIKELSDGRPDLLVQEYASPSSVLGFLLARYLVPRVAFRFLPTHDTWVERTILKELMKHWLFRGVDAIKTAGPDGLSTLESYRVPHERRFAVTQSVDIDHYAAARRMPVERRCQLRHELGLHGCVFLYVGRLWEKKGLDTLVEAFRNLSMEGEDISLLLVGDGVDEERYRRMTRDLSSVVFAGFIQKSQLPDYFAVSDVFVFPTLGDPHGLVVDEAMAAGLPVVSSDAAGDIRERVPEGKAGYVVPAADSVALSERMRQLVADPELRLRLATTASELVVTRSHERYAEDFERFVFRVMEMPPRRSISSALSSLVGRGLAMVLRMPRYVEGSRA